jgi:putative ABC transport system permease protein
MRELLRRLWYLVRQRRRDADLSEEMAFHREMAHRDLERGGAESSDAALAVRRAFGSTALAADQAHDVWVPRWLQGIGRDLGLAARLLWKARLVTGVAVLSLALGIGANTAIFSLINSLLLRPLPVRDPGRLAMLVEPVRPGTTDDYSGVPIPVRYAVWEQIHQHRELFDGVTVWSAETFDLGSGADTQPVDGLWVSAEFFDVLGVPAIAGRAFSGAADHVTGGDDPIAVISYRFWQHQFGGVRDAIGRTLRLDSVPFTVVGITPPAFFGPEVGRNFDVIVPIGVEPRLHGGESWVTPASLASPLRLMARLRDGQSLDGANGALRAIQPAIRAATLPDSYPAQFRSEYLKDPLTLTPIGAAATSLRNRYSRPLLTLMGVVALVLLIACGNVANLLLARATARRHELSVRRALGASRWRLVRQLLAESVLLAAIAAAAGFVLATSASRVLVRQLSTEAVPMFLDLSQTTGPIAFTIGVSALTVLLFGVLPSFRASAIGAADALSARGRSADRRAGVASSLVVAQVALSLVLVATSGLLVRTFTSLSSRELGFDPSRVLVVRISARHSAIAPAQRPAIYERIRSAAANVPGVAAAAFSAKTPIVTGPMFGQPIKDVSGGPALPPRGGFAQLNLISSGWFAALGTPLVAGRDFAGHDVRGTTRITIVNEAFARKFLNGADPLGHTVTLYLPGQSPAVEIVGVARDAVYGTLRNPTSPTMYMPISQLDELILPFIASVNLMVRSQGAPPAQLARSVAGAIMPINPDLALAFHPLSEELDDSLTQERVVATLSGLFGAVALLLAALGLYGVTSYAVVRRRTEIGVRMALGATPGGIVVHMLRRVAVLVGGGIVIGAGASVWTSRFVAVLLYGVTPHDPPTLAGAAVILTGVAVVAAWLPARRASRIDPAIALREQ